MRDYTLYLKDILEAMETIEKFVEGVDFDSFQKNDMVSSAVIRKFSLKTPLNIEVRTTIQYWEYLVSFKHPVMKNKEDIVKSVLQMPDEIRQSKMDKDVFITNSLIDCIA